jgi:hypothetical protein
MKYLCTGDFGTPVIGADYEHQSEALALRHARAMLEVLMASKAEQRAESKTMRTRRDEPDKYHAANAAWARAGERYRAAVARLERIEKEVRGG